MSVATRFAELITSEDPPLDEGALLIAAARPDVPADFDVAEQIGRFDDLAAGCGDRTLDGLRVYLFQELGFRGNEAEYSDPANSYLDAVLDRRLGIPITLAVVAIEVGRRVGVPLAGVSMPGHFLVRSTGDPGLLIDAFRGGRAIGEPDARRLFDATNPGSEFDPSFLAPVGTRVVLWRMLNNLRNVFAMAGSLENLRWVLDLQVTFPDIPATEQRLVAAMLGTVGRLDTAADTLDEVADRLAGDAADKARAQARILRARMN